MSNENADRGDRPILTEHRDGLATVTLNRPDKLNAVTGEMMADLHVALRDAADDAAVRAVLLRGAGRAFCTGQDLSARDPRKQSAPFDLEHIQRAVFHPVINVIRTMEKPVIAAVHGAAAGAGASVALSADIVLAADNAKLIWSFAKVGLSVDAGGGHLLVKALGSARARGLLMTAGMLTGAQAAEAGLIWKAVPEGDLMAEAEALARTFASGPTTAYAAIKQAVQAAEDMDHGAYLAEEARLQGIAGRTADYREGVLSFLEQRPAKFTGR